MNSYDETVILAKRNFEAMNTAMQHFEHKRAEDAAHVQALERTVAQLAQQVQQLTIEVALLRARSMGTGATQ